MFSLRVCSKEGRAAQAEDCAAEEGPPAAKAGGALAAGPPNSSSINISSPPPAGALFFPLLSAFEMLNQWYERSDGLPVELRIVALELQVLLQLMFALELCAECGVPCGAGIQ